MDRPKCEWGGIGGCERPATFWTKYLHNDRSLFSCKDHLERWGKYGHGYWWGSLLGFQGSADNVIEDIMADNIRRAAARRARAAKI